MNNLFGGSVCLTELVEQAKKGHSAFSKAQNGKVYFNMLTWANDEPDKFGNTMSHQLSSSKELRETEGKIYIGNSKPLETKAPVKASDIKEDFSNVPVRTKSDISHDDLPF